jgi:long-chain acyl-CoA synthetase
VFITGRLSSVIVTESGENIQPDEVESAYEQHPFIREIGVFERNRRLAAVVVPEGGGVAESGRTADEAIRDALEERGAKMPSYKRIADVALSREELPRTRLGKIRRHLLPELFERGSGAAVAAPREGGPMAVEEMSSADRGLLADPAAGKVWKMLGRRFADRRLTPDTSPQLDLGVDSLGWLEVSLDIRDATGVEIDEEAIGRIETLRDLLGEVAKRAAAGPAGRGDPFTEPRRYLDASGRRWLEAPGPVNRLLARILYTVNQAVMHTYFRVTVRGTENLYAVEQFVLAPNHVSYLDSFALAAAIPYDLLRRTAWAGGTRPAFANPLNRFVSRLAGAIPIRHALSAGSEMALAVAVIDQGKNLIWYPEGRREPRGELLPFRPGIGLLLRHRPLPVLSVRIRGTGRAMPIGRIVPRPAAIEVSFDRPREVGELMAAAVGEKRGGEERRIVAGLRAVHEELGKA